MFVGVFLIMAFAPDLVFNDGYYDVIDVTIPDGCALRPQFPGAARQPAELDGAAVRRRRRRVLKGAGAVRGHRRLRNQPELRLLGHRRERRALPDPRDPLRRYSGAAVRRRARRAFMVAAVQGGADRVPGEVLPAADSSDTRPASTPAVPAITAGVTGSRRSTSSSPMGSSPTRMIVRRPIRGGCRAAATGHRRPEDPDPRGRRVGDPCSRRRSRTCPCIAATGSIFRPRAQAAWVTRSRASPSGWRTDVRAGLVSIDAARSEYGVVVSRIRRGRLGATAAAREQTRPERGRSRRVRLRPGAPSSE